MSSYRKNRGLLPCGKSKTDWTLMLLSFLVFCVIGWIYEVLVFYFELGYGFVNRGFLFGPWLPVYGCGGMLILLSMNSLKKKKITIGKINVTPLLCFIAIILLCTTVELLTSYIMELATGSWLWDYTEDGPNFQGRIALKSSIRFGLIVIACLYGLYPIMEKCFETAKQKCPKVFYSISYLMIGLFLLDVAARFFVGGNYVGP